MLVILLSSVSISGSDSTMVANLRSKLKYKLVFDALMEIAPEKEVYGPFVSEQSEDEDNFKVLEPQEPSVLEEFRYFFDYRLYAVESLDRKQYYLLARFDLGLKDVYLFQCDNTIPKLSDTYKVSGSENSELRIDSLNHRRILRITIFTFGTGHFGKAESVVGIYKGKFQNLFEYKMVDASNLGMAEGTSYRSISKIVLNDVNRDGYSDVVQQTTDDIIEVTPTMGEFEKEIRNAKVLKHISARNVTFFWDNKTLSLKPQDP